MDNYIYWPLLIQKYGNFRRIENKIIRSVGKQKDNSKLEMRTKELINELSQTIEKGNRLSKKFKICIELGDLVSPFSNDKNCKVIYDGKAFNFHPKKPNGINSNNFIVNNVSYGGMKIVFIDEKNNIFSIKKYYDWTMLDETNLNKLLFLSKEGNELLQEKITTLVVNFIEYISYLSNEERLQFGIYKEKIGKQQPSTKMVVNSAISEKTLDSLNILTFNELVSKSVFKLFKGQILTDIEKIILSKLTEKQMINILNQYIQNYYAKEKLDIYLRNIREIVKMGSSINFIEHKEVASNIIPFPKITPTKTTPIYNSQNNIIEIDFVKKRK